jgi:hypothetical protein
MSSLSCRWLMACSTLLFCSFLLTSPARAEYSMLVGEFDGGEPRSPEGGNCGGAEIGHSYQTVGFSVSKDGNYLITNAFSSWDWWDGDLPGYGLDTELFIYDGAVNPANLQQNQVAWLGSYYEQPNVSLLANRAYTMLLLHPCWSGGPATGTWAVIINGAGSAQSAARRDIPEISTGNFEMQSPTVKGRCGETLQNLEVAYKQIGPIRVSRAGNYYFADVRGLGPVDTCQAIYSAPMDPANIKANLLGNAYQGTYARSLQFRDQWKVELEADTDYWLVLQPQHSAATSGSYLFLMAPPAPQRINPGMTGLWADPGTPGQGMYLDVFNSIDYVFMAWFTYDLQRPGPASVSALGDPGHRWLTGLGAIEGNSSEIPVVWTAGGVFDSSNPKPSRSLNGQIRLEFDTCTSGRAIYDFGTPSLSGMINLQRPFEDALGIAQCEQFTQGPGAPGPL